MSNDNAFTKGLFAAYDKLQLLEERLTTTMSLNDSDKIEAAYYKSLQVHESAEELALITRNLPVLTGRLDAETEIRKTVKKTVPIEIGFTKEGWFSVRLFSLLPRKEHGGVNYIRSSLYPAMREFFHKKPPVRFNDCIVIYRHVYAKDTPRRKKRDYDNIEINQLMDIIALFVMHDDGPEFCNVFHCAAEGNKNRCEIYVVPRDDFIWWLDSEEKMPEEGVKLYPDSVPK